MSATMSVAARTRATSSSGMATARTVLAGCDYRRRAAARPALRTAFFAPRPRPDLAAGTRLAVFLAGARLAVFFAGARFAVFLAGARFAVFLAAVFLVRAVVPLAAFLAAAFLAVAFLAAFFARARFDDLVLFDPAAFAAGRREGTAWARTAWAADRRAIGTRNGEQLT